MRDKIKKLTQAEKNTPSAFDKEGIAHFSARLKELIGNESIRSFGEKVGITDSGLRKYLPPNNSKPTFDKLVAIADYKGVRLEWLATGNGPKLVEPSSINLDHYTPKEHIFKNINVDNLFSVCAYCDDGAQPEMNEANDAINEEFVLVPGYHIQVSTGHGTSAIDAPVKRYLAFRRKYIQYRKLDPNKLAVIFAKGDSMEPTIKDNDSLLVDLSANKPLDGKIFVVRLGDELYAKRIQKSFDGSLRLISDNEEYSPIEVSTDQLDQLCIIGRVVQRSTDL
ncbi:S24 family peptidase [Photobacterium nomapromontoriensis]|uniref:S24 family peptidase n=1 Tax=Photobacterium nomapromontoriensis TaxID=2910237 RepID=UPI003D135921